MGKVFSFSEIERGRIPSPNDFQRVKQELRNAVKNSPVFLGGLLYGSALYEVQSSRSDIDVLLIYQNGLQKEARSEFLAIAKHAKACNIEIEQNMIELEIAQSAFHSITPSFRLHLEKAAARGGIIVGNPLDLLQKTEEPKITTAQLYFQNRIRFLEKGILKTSSNTITKEKLDFIGKAFQAVKHSCRIVCYTCDVLPEIDESQYLFEAYERLTNQECGIRDILHRELILLRKVDSEYTRIVQQLQHQPDKKLYQGIIHELWNQTPRILFFVKQNVKFLQQFSADL